MTETSDDSKRCRWPDCDCYSPIGPQTCRKATPAAPMTKTVPERIGLVSNGLGGWRLWSRNEGDDIWEMEAVPYVPATALEAAQARIVELQDRVLLAYNLARKAEDFRKTARREALEEAAKVAENVMMKYAELTYDQNHDKMQNAAKTYCAGEIEVTIRALMEKLNDQP